MFRMFYCASAPSIMQKGERRKKERIHGSASLFSTRLRQEMAPVRKKGRREKRRTNETKSRATRRHISHSPGANPKVSNMAD